MYIFSKLDISANLKLDISNYYILLITTEFSIKEKLIRIIESLLACKIQMEKSYINVNRNDEKRLRKIP